MSDPKQNPGYVDDKLLQVIAEKLKPVKKRSYELLKIKPGDMILDAGCGPGIDTTSLAKRFGEGVSIVGIDYDPQMIAEARERTENLGLSSQIEHMVGDITALEFETGKFDAVRCDRVLQHISRGEKAIAELVRVTKPGGSLVLFDPDWSTFSIDYPDPDLEWRMRRVATERFANGYAGRQSWARLVRQGVIELQAESFSFTFSYPEVRYILLMDRVESAALQNGLINTVELENWHNINEAAHGKGEFLASVTGIMVSGAKP